MANVSESDYTRFDRTDRRILDILQTDGRITNLELAERINLSPTPCLRRLRLLEEAEVVLGYRAVLNREAVGLELTVFVFASLERHAAADAAGIRKALAALPEVVDCHVISGEFDLLLRVLVPSLTEYRRFSLERLLKVPGIRDIRTSVVIDTIVENRPLPLAHIR